MATLTSFKSRVSQLVMRGRSKSSQQSDSSVIVRHRIVKPRLDDELAALEDARHRHRFPHRRPRAWRDANAIIPNLTHPHANMPQDVLDDLRVIDERFFTALNRFLHSCCIGL